jgi:hypothetical protein
MRWKLFEALAAVVEKRFNLKFILFASCQGASMENVIQIKFFS